MTNSVETLRKCNQITEYLEDAEKSLRRGEYSEIIANYLKADSLVNELYRDQIHKRIPFNRGLMEIMSNNLTKFIKTVTPSTRNKGQEYTRYKGQIELILKHAMKNSTLTKLVSRGTKKVSVLKDHIPRKIYLEGIFDSYAAIHGGLTYKKFEGLPENTFENEDEAIKIMDEMRKRGASEEEIEYMFGEEYIPPEELKTVI